MKSCRTILALLVILTGIPSCGDRPRSQEKPMGTMFTKEGELTVKKSEGTLLATFDIEIADTPQRRETGLMGRPVMAENHGMLFVFEEDQYLSFWMMNTMIPLDILFLDSKGVIITVHRNTVPYSQGSYASTDVGRYVLELNAGTCDRFGITEGDVAEWKRLE